MIMHDYNGDGVKHEWNNLRNIRTLSNGTFDKLKIYGLITCFPFSTRTALYKNRNTTLNTLMLILTLKNIRMKETVINSLKNSF